MARSSSSLAMVAMTLLCLGSGCGAELNTGGNNSNGNGGDAGAGCVYSLQIFPASPQLGDTVTLEVNGSGSCGANGYSWQLVSSPAPIPETLTLRSGDRIADLVPTAAGTYVVAVDVNDFYLGVNPLQSGFTVIDPAGTQKPYVLRFTPPAGVAAPRQQQTVIVTGGTPLTNQVFTLDGGMLVAGTLQGSGGPFGGYLRLTQAGFPLYREVFAPPTGDFSVSVLPTSIYDVLIIPDGVAPAPDQRLGLTVGDLTDPATFQLDDGISVLGYLRDDLDAAVVDAQIVLRAGSLPSGVGTADLFDGRFVLLGRDGDVGVDISPPAGTPLPRAAIAPGSGVLIDPVATVELTWRWADPVPRALDLQIVAGNPPVPLSGARVTVESEAFADVGTMEVTHDATLIASIPAGGEFRVTFNTDAAGASPPLSVPAGIYRLVVEPGQTPAPPGFGATIVEGLDLSAGDLTGQVTSLANEVHLSGAVVDRLGDPVAGVRVVAVTDLGLGYATEVMTNDQGHFVIPVVEGASYDIQVLPDPSFGLAVTVIPGVVPIGTTTIVGGTGPGGTIELDAGLTLGGSVLLSGNPLGGVIVQVIDESLPGAPVIAEVVTTPSGNFQLSVPDPGGP